MTTETLEIGPGDRDFQTLENVAYRRFRKVGLSEEEARDEALSAAYLMAEALHLRVMEWA